MKRIAAYILALCLAASLAGCGIMSRDVLHLGLDAEILEIDADNPIIYVKGLDTHDDFFGERRMIDCSRALETFRVFYVDDSDPDDNLKNISLSDLYRGDMVVIAAYESELNNPKDGAITVEQIQLNHKVGEKRSEPMTEVLK